MYDLGLSYETYRLLTYSPLGQMLASVRDVQSAISSLAPPSTSCTELRDSDGQTSGILVHNFVQQGIIPKLQAYLARNGKAREIDARVSLDNFQVKVDIFHAYSFM
jgi:hypothetical protein